jgi:beta-lactamase class A
MMKVAVMITYFKEAEQDPDILQKILVYSTSTVDQINGVPFSAASGLQVGKSYSVEKLIEAMIINSDNGAKDVLLDNINQQSFVEVHTDLGLPNPAAVQNYTITAKQYAVLLRVLYGATYLGRQYSEKALQIMSQATYNEGLVAGVPKGTAVAQKFGEALDSTNPSAPEINLSDCGIIYHPTHPYILCVMTKGKNINSLTQTISSISNVVWNQVAAYADGK